MLWSPTDLRGTAVLKRQGLCNKRPIRAEQRVRISKPVAPRFEEHDLVGGRIPPRHYRQQSLQVARNNRLNVQSKLFEPGGDQGLNINSVE